MKLMYIFILLMWLNKTLNAQEVNNNGNIFYGIKEGKARIDFDKKKRYFYVSPKKRGNWKQLNIEFRTDDSISVYLNDSLVYSQWIRHSESPSASYDAYIPFQVPRNDNGNYLTVVLNKRSEYIRFKVYKRYSYIDAYFTENKTGTVDWIVIHENNMPSE